MGIVEVFSTPLDIIKKNPIVLLPYLIFTILATGIPLAIIYSAIPSFASMGAATSASTVISQATVAVLIELIVVIAVIAIASLFVSPLLVGMYLSVARQGRSNQKVSLSKAWEEAKSRYVSLLGALVLVGVIALIVFAILFIILFLLILAPSASAAAIFGVLVTIILFIIAVIALEVLFFQAGVAVMLEGRRAVAAVKRSIEIGGANIASIFGTVVLMAMIAGVVSLIFSLFGLIFLVGGEGAYLTGQVILQVIEATLFGTWFAMVPATFYYNYISPLRPAAVAPASPASAPTPPPTQPAAPAPKKPTASKPKQPKSNG